MIDGCIDAQGTIPELRQRGIIGQITAETRKEHLYEISETHQGSQDGQKDIEKYTPKAKKFVENEEVAEGGVKRSVYLSYIEASCVSVQSFLLMIRDELLLGHI